MVERNINGCNLRYHPEKVAEWFEKKDCYPIYMEIGPTNRCNHKCIFCALDWVEHKGYDIDKEMMLKTLENMAIHGVKSVMFAGEGEPLLHKNIFEFVQHAKKHGLYTAITTNGVLFDKEKAEECLPYLTWLRFSIDAGTRESYAKIHKTKEKDFDRVIENIENISEIKRKKRLKTNTGVQFLMIPDNINEVLKFAETFKEAGADNIQIKPYSQHPKSINKFVINYKDYIHLGSELEKFNSDNFKVLFRKKTIQRLEEGINYDYCYGLSFFALVDAKGNVIPCNLFYNQPEFAYGNLYEQSFSEIWESEKRKEVLEKLRKKGVKDCREVCRLDAVNRYLYDLENVPKEETLKKLEEIKETSDLKNLPEYVNFI